MDDDSERRINIPPYVWKDAEWDTIAISVLTYPKSFPSARTIQDTRNMLIAKRTTLGCSTCRHNWIPEIEAHPPTDAVLASRESYASWFCDRFRKINPRRRHLSNDEILAYFVNRLVPKKGLSSNCKKLLIVGGIALGAYLVYKAHQQIKK